jgi:Spy/CpxP family protein refolding chaperone
VVRLGVGRFGWPVALFLLVGLGSAPPALQGQDPERPRTGEISREEMMQRVLRQYERRMVQELGLTAEQFGEIQSVMSEFRAERSKLMRERRELRNLVRERRGRSGMEAGEARDLLERVRDLRERELALQQAEERRLLETLEPEQLLGLQLLREDLGDRIRRLHTRTRPRPRRESRGGEKIRPLYEHGPVGQMGPVGKRRLMGAYP